MRVGAIGGTIGTIRYNIGSEIKNKSVNQLIKMLSLNLYLHHNLFTCQNITIKLHKNLMAVHLYMSGHFIAVGSSVGEPYLSWGWCSKS